MSSSKMISRAKSVLAAMIALGLSTAAAAQSGIEVQSLDALDPLEVSLPGAAFSMTLWDGSSRDTALAALAALPSAQSGQYPSDTLAELARAVLVSGGYPPVGARGDQELAVVRADRLVVAGGALDAYDLLERTPNLNRIEPLSRWHAELALTVGDFDRACRSANALLEGRDRPYWLRVRAFCLALSGQGSAAELTAELAAGVEADAEFDRLLFALTLDQELTGPPITIGSGLELALMRSVRLADDALLQTGDETPQWLRTYLASGETAIGYSDDPASDIARAEALDANEREALLISILAQGEDRELAAQALSLLLDDAAARDELLTALRLYGPEIATLPQTAGTLADGVRFALAAAVYGDIRTARAWRNGLLDGPRAPLALFDPSVSLPEAGAATETNTETDKPEEPVVIWTPPAVADMVALDYALMLASGRIDGDEGAAIFAATEARFEGAVLADLLALQRLGAMVPSGLRTGLLAREAIAVPVALLAMEEALVVGAEAEAVLFAIAALDQADATSAAEIYPRVATLFAELDLAEALFGILLERHVQRAF